MQKNKKNEELQSRREFFKKAAKGALPILGLVALANVPGVLNAATDAPMGCSSGSCYRGCASTCSGYCTTTCNASCYHSHARKGSRVESIER